MYLRKPYVSCDEDLITKAFLDDGDLRKVDLTAGLYKGPNGESVVFPSVTEAKLRIVHDLREKKRYLTLLGEDEYNSSVLGLVLGENNPVIENGLAFAMQAPGGTGALRLAAEFCFSVLKYKFAYFSSVTWEAALPVFRSAGFTRLRRYRYWDKDETSLDFDGLVEDLKEAPRNSIVHLQVCGHHPTGFDPSADEWESIANIVIEHKLFPLFDMAYQGCVTGDLDLDAYPVRLFTEKGIELMIAYSFSKNMNIANLRTGSLMFVVNKKEVVIPIKSQMNAIIDRTFGPPQTQGPQIVVRILKDPNLMESWKTSLLKMAHTMTDVRHSFANILKKVNTEGDWDSLTYGAGMWSILGELTPKRVEHLVLCYHIYMMRNGSVAISSLYQGNIKYVAYAIEDTVKEHTEDRRSTSREKVSQTSTQSDLK